MYFARNFVPGSTARKLSGFWNGSHVDIRRDEIWVDFDGTCMLLWPRWEPAAFALLAQHYKRFNWHKRSDRKKLRRFARRVVRSWVDPFVREREHDREWIKLIEQCIAEIKAGQHGEDSQAAGVLRNLEGQARLLRAKVSDPLAYRSPLYIFEDRDERKNTMRALPE